VFDLFLVQIQRHYLMDQTQTLGKLAPGDQKGMLGKVFRLALAHGNTS
jgi:hypothetical protein